MRISREELQCYRPRNNYVLCEPILEVDKIQSGKFNLFIDPTYRPEHHQPVIQKVISTNRHLIYGRKRQLMTYEHGTKTVEYINGKKNPLFNYWYESTMEDAPIENSMPWKTDMEVREGDIIWCDFVEIFNAVKRNRVVYCEDKTYYLISYDKIYCAKSEKELKILNGWVFVEPIEYGQTKPQEIAERSGLKLVHIEKHEAPEDRFGIVRFIGKPIEEYVNLDQSDTDEISVGDTILLKFKFNRRLEHQTHLIFSDKMLAVTRRPWIAGIIRDSLFSNLQ